MTRSSTGRFDVRGLRRRRPTTVGLRVESLEARRLMSIYTVDSNLDNNVRDGVLTLREAIMVANGALAVGSLSGLEQLQVTPGGGFFVDNINFKIATGPQTITLTSALPTLTKDVNINGRSQEQGTPSPTPLIEINGNGQTALAFNAIFGSTVNDLTLNRFAGSALILSNNNNTITGNYIGTNAAGTSAAPNTGDGISMLGSVGNTIGGTTAALRNVISGNAGNGITLGTAGANSGNNNKILGNYIGLDAAGSTKIANLGVGISINGGSGNTIGGSNPGSGNVISGNGGNGINLSSSLGASSFNLIAGNRIGTDQSGATRIGNRATGIVVTSASGTTIGGTNAGASNLISGSIGATSNGITITSSTGGTLILGNKIGTDLNGLNALANDGTGVEVDNDTTTTIGGTTAAGTNLISGNGGNGITLNNSNNIVIRGNSIGVDSTGGSALGNSGSGISIIGTSSSATIGNTTAVARNVISGNGGAGISIAGIVDSVGGHSIQGNYIGTDSTGSVALGNTLGGVLITDSRANTIGGVATGAGNLISGNNAANAPGISVLTTSTNSSVFNLIQANLVGTDFTGTSRLANNIGVRIQTGLTQVTNNLISGNTNDGIVIFATLFRVGPTTVQGNLIGVDTTNTLNLGNGGWGVDIPTISPFNVGNLIGGTAAQGNTIAFNRLGGVRVAVGNSKNTILSNSIYQNNIAGGKLGIDISPAGPVANLTAAIIGSANTIIRGTYNGLANTPYRFQFFASPNGSPGQGMTYLTRLVGDYLLTSDATGLVDLARAIPPDLTISYPPAVAVGSYITATVTDPSNSTSEFSNAVQVTAISTFTINVVPSPTPAYLGGAPITYTISVTNNGPSPASNIAVINTAPTGSLNIVASPPAGGTASTVGLTSTLTIPSLNANATVVLSVTVTPSSTGTYTDLASLTYTGTTYSASASDQVLPAADLQLNSATSTTAPNNLGQHIIYTVNVQNTGASTALNTQVTDTLPSVLQFSSATIFQGGVAVGSFSVSGSPQTFTALLGDLAPGAAPITISLDALIVGTGVLIGNTINVTSVGGTHDVNLLNNTVTLTNTFSPATDLSVTSFTASGPTSPTPPYDPSGTPLINQNLTFTILVHNAGPSIAQSALVDITLPTTVGYLPVSATTSVVGGSASFAGDGVIASLGDLAVGADATITFILKPTAVGAFAATATATAATNELMPVNNVQSLSVDVKPVVNLSTTVIAQPSPIVAGKVLTYTIIVTNNGPSDATNVTVTDILPAGITGVLVSPSQGTSSYDSNSNVAIANFGLLKNGKTATVQIFVTPTAGGTIINQANITSDAKNLFGTSSVTTPVVVIPAADLAVTTVATPSPAPIGQQAVVVVTVTNNGPSAATNVSLVDVLPATGYILSSPIVVSQGTLFSQTGTTYTYNLGTINAGATATLTIYLTPNALGSITTTATATTTAADQNLINNSSTLVLPVNPAADLAILAAPVPTLVIRGGTINYSLTVTNNGPSPATNVVVTDLLPAGAAYISSSSNAGTVSVAGTTLTATLGTLAVGQTVTILLTVVPTVAGTYTNVASVSSTTIDYNPVNNSVSQTSTVAGEAGSLQFSASNYSVGENAGMVAITVQRVGGTAGEVTVNYTTGGGTATPKYNYTPVSGTLVFNDGETSKTIMVPVLNDNTPDSGTIVGIQLSSPGLGGTLGVITSATIAIADTNGDLIPGPKIVSVQRAGSGSTLQIVLTFNSPMDPGTAQNVANYVLTTPGRPPRRGAPATLLIVPIKSAFYDPATRTVTLTVGTKVSINAAFTLSVNGQIPNGVKSGAGILIDGANTGRNGTNFVTVLDAIDPRFARIWAQYLKSRLPKVTIVAPRHHHR